MEGRHSRGAQRLRIDALRRQHRHRRPGVLAREAVRLQALTPPQKSPARELVGGALAGSRTLCQITHVSTDGAQWITDVIDERCPNAVRGADRYHVAAWATEALDQVRRDVWNTARGGNGAIQRGVQGAQERPLATAEGP
ncbi:transposase [Micromonospora sp. NPDC023966]|uniref:transposase n=1 Tax=Micromonospora sp. NPDC023966 TaxID=3154699 RepID=UPI0033E55ADC